MIEWYVCWAEGGKERRELLSGSGKGGGREVTEC